MLAVTFWQGDFLGNSLQGTRQLDFVEWRRECNKMFESGRVEWGSGRLARIKVRQRRARAS